MEVVALEASTSSAKAIRYDPERGVVDLSVQAYPEEVAGETTIVPDGMLSVAMDVLREVVLDAEEPPAAVGLCGTWHSLLYLDQHDEPEGPIRTWVDTTGREFVETTRSDSKRVEAFYRKTGCLAHAMYPFWKHACFQRAGRFDGRSAPRISSQIEYLFQALTGERAVSRCTASGSGFYHLHDGTWGDELLSFAGVERDQLAPLRDETYTAPLQPEPARTLGLPDGTPVTVGAADGAMNQLGVAGTRGDIMSCSVGTSGAVRLGVTDASLPHDGGTWCYYMHNDTFVAGGATHGINCADWYLDLLNAGRDVDGWDYTALDGKARETTLEDAPYFLPFLFGERAPGWDEDRRAMIAGLSNNHGPGAVYHAIQEGILFGLYDCYRRLLDHWNPSPERIVISGGILNSERWTQMAADIFQVELSATGRAHDSTVGAAMLAEKAVRETSFASLDVGTDVVAKPRGTDVYETYMDRFRTYRSYYRV